MKTQNLNPQPKTLNHHRGQAVMWDNVTKDGKTADGRMIHEVN